jgi:hypothetical protein
LDGSLRRRFGHLGLCSEACLGDSIASDEVTLQHEGDVICAGLTDCCHSLYPYCLILLARRNFVNAPLLKYSLAKLGDDKDRLASRFSRGPGYRRTLNHRALISLTSLT